MKIETKDILDLEILRNLWYVYCFISFYDLGDALQFYSFDCCEKGDGVERVRVTDCELRVSGYSE